MTNLLASILLFAAPSFAGVAPHRLFTTSHPALEEKFLPSNALMGKLKGEKIDPAVWNRFRDLLADPEISQGVYAPWRAGLSDVFDAKGLIADHPGRRTPSDADWKNAFPLTQVLAKSEADSLAARIQEMDRANDPHFIVLVAKLGIMYDQWEGYFSATGLTADKVADLRGKADVLYKKNAGQIFTADWTRHIGDAAAQLGRSPHEVAQFFPARNLQNGAEIPRIEWLTPLSDRPIEKRLVEIFKMLQHHFNPGGALFHESDFSAREAGDFEYQLVSDHKDRVLSIQQIEKNAFLLVIYSSEIFRPALDVKGLLEHMTGGIVSRFLGMPKVAVDAFTFSLPE